MIIIQKYGEIDFYGIGKSRMKTMSQKQQTILENMNLLQITKLF